MNGVSYSLRDELDVDDSEVTYCPIHDQSSVITLPDE